MRRIQTEVVGAASITNPRQVEGRAHVRGDGPVGTLSIDVTLTIAVQPRSLVPVWIGIELVVGGAVIPLSAPVGPVTVNRSLDSHMQTAEFALKLEDAEGIFGNPLDFHGPPFGRAPIDIFGVYRVPGGVRRLPLLRNGVVNDISRSGNPESGYVERYTLADFAGAIDQQTVTLTLPAGHGLDRAAIVQRLFSQLGVTSFALVSAGPVSKISEWIDADVFRAAKTLLEPKGRVVLFNINGALSNPRVGPVSGLSPRWSFDERDVISGTDVTVTVPCDVVTDVTLTTSQQITSDPAEVQGLESAASHSWIEQDFQPTQAAYRQTDLCTTVALAPPPDSPRRVKISETFGVTETLAGVVIGEASENWAWHQIEAARYQWAMGGDRHCIPDVYLLADANPAGNGTEPAFVELVEQWRKVAASSTRHYYDAAGYSGPASLSSDETPWGNHFDGNSRSSRTNYELGQVTDTYGWGFTRRATKQRVVGQTWEDTDPITGLLTDGAGDGVTTATEAFGLRSREVVTIEATAAGLLKRVTTYTFGWAAPARAGEYFYNSGTVSDEPEEVFALTALSVVDYEVIGQAFRQITTQVDYTKGRIEPTITYGPSSAGAPPAVGRLQSNTPDPAIYSSDAEAQGALSANPLQTQNVKIRAIADGLERTNWKGVVKTEAPYAENIDELAEMARLIIDYSAAGRVSWPVSVNFDVREGDPVRFLYRPLGVDHMLQVHAVTHTVDPDGQSISLIDARKYPE